MVDNVYGATPLHFSTRSGHVELVRILLANKACVNAIDYIHGATPLHFASQNGYIELVKILLDVQSHHIMVYYHHNLMSYYGISITWVRQNNRGGAYSNAK